MTTSDLKPGQLVTITVTDYDRETLKPFTYSKIAEVVMKWGHLSILNDEGHQAVLKNYKKEGTVKGTWGSTQYGNKRLSHNFVITDLDIIGSKGGVLSDWI